MKRLLVFALGCFCFAHAADDLDKLTYVLKKMADEAELFKPGGSQLSQPTQPVGPRKLLVVCDGSVERDQFIEQLKIKNGELGGKLFVGEIEFDNASAANRIDDIAYKIIFLCNRSKHNALMFFTHDGFFPKVKPKNPLGPERGCVVLQVSADKTVTPMAFGGALSVNKVGVDVPGFIWQEVVHKTLWITTGKGYELGEIVWPNNSKIANVNIKTIYDWLLWY